jgi:hypothetical protein
MGSYLLYVFRFFLASAATTVAKTHTGGKESFACSNEKQRKDFTFL